jgi:sec-independent protein translocase protein TatB
MFSFGWSEIALVVVVVIIVVGPKELPNLIKQLGSFSKSLKKISREFKSSLNELAKESDIKDIKKTILDVSILKKDLDPTKSLKNELASIKKTVSSLDDDIVEADKKIKKD